MPGAALSLLRRPDLGALALVVAITLVARLIPALMLGTEVADVTLYRQMALTVVREEDIYDVHNLFPYTPLSLFIPSFALHLSGVLDQPFHLVIKFFPMAGDVGTAALVYLLALRRWGAARAALVGLAFAFNPVSILITSFHGNIMPLSVFFAFWAYYLLEAGDRERTYVLSALSLGIGIGLRGWPVLLLPFLLRPGQLSWRQRVVYLAVAAFPSVSSLAPYWLVNAEGIRRELFEYQGFMDFGWMAIWRALWFLETGYRDLPGTQGADWLSASRNYFLFAYAALVGVAFLRPRLLDTAGWIASGILLLYSMVGGISAQYLVWVLPFLALNLFGVAYALVAFGAIATFYLSYFPAILLGPYPSPIEYTLPEITRWHLGFLLATWAAGALWLLWVVMKCANQGLRFLAAVRSPAPAG